MKLSPRALFNMPMALLGVVVLAFLLPGLGNPGGALRPEITTKIGVVVIFLLQGLALPTERLGSDLKHWKLHLLVQANLFLIVPLVVVPLVLQVPSAWLPQESLRWGLIYLVLVPTTISTSIVFSLRSGGNVAAALLNTTVANVVGVFYTPLVARGLMGVEGGESVPVLPLLLKIGALVLLPLIVGQVMRLRLASWAAANKSIFARVNTGIILFMVFVAFSRSAGQGVWTEYGLPVVVVAVVGSLAVITLAKLSAWILATRVLRLGREERIVAMFCGCQRTIAAGIPMAKLIFAAGMPAGFDLSLALLPLMAYVPWQFAIGGWFVGRFARGRL